MGEITLQDVREMCGYIEDGSRVTLTIGQDECTKAWTIQVDRRKTYFGRTLGEALAKCKAGDESIPPGL